MTAAADRVQAGRRREQCSRFSIEGDVDDASSRPPSDADRHPLPPQPGWFTRNVFNRIVVVADPARHQRVGLAGAARRGRTSGEWRKIPVNLLEHDGPRYLVAPRGDDAVGAQPARRRDAASCGSAAGSRRSAPPRSPTTTRSTILRAYLRRWKMEVGVFFDGVGPDASDDELRAIGDRHPVFRIDTAPTGA